MGRAAAVAAEVLAWWLLLTGAWLVLISTVDALEYLVGASAALLAAVAAQAARRAMSGR
ncbi:hypothetical protein [Streptomyces violascens]|jgi:hypothetical protein|uniref:Secreted protein n=1 Tax=Streptomyces violascens TaxID=67381 RepID=A0ABQ3QUD5_9ACTN|nr:hypothetical protein [Streptomyces violascens]GGU06298.1 hypothetical protein GCM10010289_29280 [Streptomyces violascens]GHI40870.1 hypothetical protein Sviol_52780 [Streptomyces violascens]